MEISEAEKYAAMVVSFSDIPMMGEQIITNETKSPYEIFFDNLLETMKDN